MMDNALRRLAGDPEELRQLLESLGPGESLGPNELANLLGGPGATRAPYIDTGDQVSRYSARLGVPEADFGDQPGRTMQRGPESPAQPPPRLQDLPTDQLRDAYHPNQGGFVRNETTGKTLFLNGQPNGISDEPYPNVAAARQPQQIRIKMAGYGNGIMSDLGETVGAIPAMDYSRPAVDTPKGKGYYGKDGAVYVKGPEGYTKILQGYDREASWQAAKHDFERRKGEGDIAHTQEQIITSQQARNTKEGLPGYGVPQSVLEKQFGKAPDGKRWSEQGQLEDVPGGGGAKLNETQGRAAGMATRAEAAHKILLELEGSGTTTPGIIKQTAESVPLVGNILGQAINTLPTAMGGPSIPQQRVEQAQRDFVNAVLRPESGASISNSEFDNARKQYFPQVGDGPEIIQQKQQARARELAALAVMAGPGGTQAIKTQATANDSAINRAKALFDAKRAIERGADPAKVKQRLRDMGVNEAI